MDIVRVIGQGVDALGATLGDVIFIGSRGIFVAFGCIFVASDSTEDMRRHMNQVTGFRFDKTLEDIHFDIAVKVRKKHKYQISGSVNSAFL